MKDKRETLPEELQAAQEILLDESSRSDIRKNSHKRSNSKSRPSPLDFEAFLPWVCVKWQSPKPVTVTRLTQDIYLNIKDRKSIPKIKLSSKRDVHDTGVRKSNASKTSQITEDVTISLVNLENHVIVKAYHDTQKLLVKVSFGTSEVPIKVIKALSLCFPFHLLLTNLSFHKSGLTSLHLYEIAKLLPHSNLTEVSLNDCDIPEGNYYVLLEQTSELKVLSLSRCAINDLACEKLVSKLEVGASGSSLLCLELVSNCITDEGAGHIAKVLRLNRTLLHLNLSGNEISDRGANIILIHLAEFALTAAEILDRRNRKMKYVENKVTIYQRCLEEMRQKLALSDIKSCSSKKSLISNKSFNRLARKKSNTSVLDFAENIAMNIVGEFVDPFDLIGVIKRNGYRYFIGNLVLCSVNLAYNNITYLTIRQICEVLRYQRRIRQCFGKTGLLRIVFEGNPIPIACSEYDEIKDLLREAVLDRVPSIDVKKKRINSDILLRKKT